jgi:redox-sensitive bicupin YhaK (pirin superfamily)
VIGPGEVQWMTAGAGILHEEFHSAAFARAGGVLQMIQLWVNLPAQDKMTPPGYQPILRQQIPELALADGSGTARVIAGSFGGQTGPARTFTPMQVVDLKLKKGATLTIPVPAGWSAGLVVLNGAVQAQDGAVAKDAQMLMYEHAGQDFAVQVLEDTVALLLCGEPIEEPIFGHGPFVMNTKAEITQAIEDFNSGRFGRIA